MDLAQYGLTDSALEFLAKQERDGNLIIQKGSNSATGDAVSYTPASGKTFFLFKAAFSLGTTFSATTTWEVICELQNNGTAIETGSIFGTNATDAGRPASIPQYPFVSTADSLVGDGAKAYSIDIITNSDSLTVHGTLIGWLEDS